MNRIRARWRMDARCSYCDNMFVKRFRLVYTTSTGWAKKTGLFLGVDNFATVGIRNARYMSKFSKFYLEKNIELAYQCVKYSLPNLHKYSMSLKLRRI